MGKIYKENDIEAFFESFKKLPIEYSLEKVHHYIESIDTSAKVSKKSNFKPFKLIVIMLSIVSSFIGILLILNVGGVKESEGQEFNQKKSVKSRELKSSRNSIPQIIQETKSSRNENSRTDNVKKYDNTISMQPGDEHDKNYNKNLKIKKEETSEFDSTESNQIIDPDIVEDGEDNKKTLQEVVSHGLFKGLNLINLSKNELRKIGFRIESDEVSILTKGGVFKWEVFFSKKGYGVKNIKFKSIKRKPKLVFVSNLEGVQNIKWTEPGDDDDKMEEEYFQSKIQELLPVVLKMENFPEILKEDKIFWFAPSDALFEALPDVIGRQLQNELVILNEAQNGQKMDANLDCFYFEACKSTLNVDNLNIYPNPAKNNATLEFFVNEESEGEILLLSISGKEVKKLVTKSKFESGINTFNINCSEVPSGIYLVMLKTKSKFKTTRLVIQK